jgi:4-hydroxybenzoate polyprenyltransferase
LLHLIAGIFVLMAGIYGNFSFIYWIGASIFSGMLFYQHSIVKPNDLSKVNIAFMTANGIASIVFASFVILDIFI